MATNKPNLELSKINRAKPKLGLQDRGLVKFDCADCSKNLMVFQITKNNVDLAAESVKSMSTKIRVQCSCGGSSYTKDVEGQFYPGSPNDSMKFEPIDIDDVARQSGVDILFRTWE